ncbi:MAG: hypothetical protein H0T89_06650 [Deltaproteobacteria bacterium]|nr:hypothetical protein [Deltaproteobacteria bacterium]MDQ3299445.1 hypothetical protein [Myxococcota bacterium]
MRQLALVAAVVALIDVLGLAACGGKESATKVGTGTASNLPPATPVASAGSATAVTDPARPAPAATKPPAEPTIGGHDFTAAAQVLLVVGACGDGPQPQGFSAELIAKHCDVIEKTQQAYSDSWLSKARPFFAEKVPKDVPKKVVYPFAGGDLSTALTVYPDADEITTLSLEPAGDPRTLAALNTPTKSGKPSAALQKALQTVQYELRFLYKVNFSNTMNMIEAMRGGSLPTQLIFGLSALKVHGYEVVALRYFKLGEAGNIVYLTDDEVANAPDAAGTANAEKRNRLFANAEVRFKKPGGHTQIYRHIQTNLDDKHIDADRRVLAHLEQKGPIAGMTKAASYLLSWDSFSQMRGYLATNVVWMVSDATGIAPKWGKAAGFDYELYGSFGEPHIEAGNAIAKNWRDEFKAQPRRALPFRFGYYDKKLVNHLVIMKRKS